ncbi:hypothetical protein [Aliiroseovarius lamellibrachiae]|nr:hypothetical protein [Aliiroseovarius lamellibrachiae]
MTMGNTHDPYAPPRVIAPVLGRCFVRRGYVVPRITLNTLFTAD